MSNSEKSLMSIPVLICTDRPASNVQSLLAEAGFRVDRLDLADANPTNPQGYQLCVVDSEQFCDSLSTPKYAYLGHEM